MSLSKAKEDGKTVHLNKIKKGKYNKSQEVSFRKTKADVRFKMSFLAHVMP